MRLVYKTKQLKTAEEVREYIKKTFHVDCSVAVHPTHTVINTRRKLSKTELAELNDWMAENMDGRLLKNMLAGVAK
mgnify:CR=1 FL=1